VSLDLVDGSHIVGIPNIKSVPLQTPYAKMDLALDQILSINIEDDHETASFELQNGDKLKGVLNLKPIGLETVFGEVSVGVQHVMNIQVHGRGALREGLVLHYTFDGDEDRNARDISGRDNHGTVSQKTVYVDSIKGKGVSTSSRDTFVACSSDDLNPNGWHEFTIAIWVKLRSYSTYSHLIGFGKADTKGHINMSLGGGPGSRFRPGFSVDTSDKPEGTVSLQLNHFATVNEWHHIAGVYDGKTLKYYVNGEEAGSKEVPDNLKNKPVYTPKGGDFIVGKHSQARSWLDTHINGIIDEVMFFRKALPQSSIKQLYRKVKE